MRQNCWRSSCIFLIRQNCSPPHVVHIYTFFRVHFTLPTVDETQLVVSGYIGPDLLQETARLTAVDDRLLKSLRDYLEDRLENRFDLVAHIGIAPTGSLQLNLNVLGDEQPTLKDIQDYAETCVQEFFVNSLHL